ncbi:MAG: hypothetical protein HOY78_10810 [Saccharothrix sp.]|nr:hypothetical protein [Saccharothrix sp.]
MRSKNIRFLIVFVLAGLLGWSGVASAVADEPVAVDGSAAAEGLAAADGLVTLAGCRAAPYSASFNLYFETENYIELGTYTTTTQCNDINIRSTNGTGYFACVVFTRLGTTCNNGNNVPASGAWVNIATDVRDYTTFNVRIAKGGANYVTHAGVMDF